MPAVPQRAETFPKHAAVRLVAQALNTPSERRQGRARALIRVAFKTREVRVRRGDVCSWKECVAKTITARGDPARLRF